MRQVSIKQLRANIRKEMDNIPFEVTKHGKVIGTMFKYVPIVDSVHIGKVSDLQGDSVHKASKIQPNGVHKVIKQAKPRKPSNRNRNIKTTSPTGGIPMAEIDAITRSYFKPQPKAGKT